MVVSDHSLVCPEAVPNRISDNTGINVGVMQELGYTVLQKDADGNDIKAIDWYKNWSYRSIVMTNSC
mgnify:CR=1 FL=1